MSQPHRADIWIVDFGQPRGREQALKRPAVILQNDDLSNLQTVIVVPITGNLERGRERGTVILSSGIGGLRQDSLVLCHQTMVVDRARLVRRLGQLPPDAVAQVEVTVAYILGLSV